MTSDLGARARLEAAFAREERRGLTRDLGTSIAASGALVAAIEREAADAKLLESLRFRGPHTLRGRDTPIELWTA